ncbi:ethyl tert-butyl ether degradation protein EthD [Siculibacillus lacustris]|uniref:Ethyl tert-butyl ether degradation protein EthD n=1 Tax=Siculibacillus lacustris TaxID=1549641 RepID=A0A4Q9VWZ2_9HYPH|nr:EthD domain-containing protein [Siculibacillus lacustris]TBW40404.1 ethyl tert-butyl ether degradation protein EthD [Siculibacillus lacustris]
MLKLTMLATRLPDLTAAAFDRHWREVHGPLVRSHAAALRIVRYVQTAPLVDAAVQETLQTTRGCLPFTFDGMGELWWTSLDDYRSVRETAAGRTALAEVMADERRFVDLSRSLLWFGAERPMIDPAAMPERDQT